MFRRFAAIVLLAVVTASVLTPVVFAVAHTVNFTAQQDTQIQTRLIPVYNAEHCLRFRQARNCSSANLVTGGCVPAVFRTLTVDSCTIFTLNTAGEDLFLQEVLNQKLVEIFLRNDGDNDAALLAAFKAATAPNQTSVCSTLSATLPAGAQCP